MPKDADSERLVIITPSKAVEFEGFTGALVRFNHCVQQVSDKVSQDKRPPHSYVRRSFVTLDVCR